MLKNYFKTAYRQLTKNRLFSLVNIIGLSAGLGSVMMLSILVYQYMTTDNIQQDIGQMYYLKTVLPDGNQYTQTPYPLLGQVVKNCPEVEAATHIQRWYYPWLKYQDKEFQETSEFVDSGYFKVFRFPFKYGRPETALADKFSMVLSEEVADKLFGQENPVGKIVIADDTMQFTITGVLKHIPSNSSIQPAVLLPTALLESNADFRSGADWYNDFASNYLRLRKNSDPKKLEEKITAIARANYVPEKKIKGIAAVPFSKITGENGTLIKVVIRGAVGAGIFILLVVLVNLINLNVATMYNRVKEVAIRQTVGGSKRSIIVQFCVENGLLILISVMLAWILFSMVLLPVINTLVKDKFGEIVTSISSHYPLIILFACIGIFLTIAAASLPAWKLTGLKVRDGLNGKISAGYKKSMVRSIFITMQFILAITLICVTIIFNRQVSYMKSAALGFSKEDVAVVNLDLAYRDPKTAGPRFESILNDLKNNPHVRAVSTNGVVPTAYWENYNIYYDPSNNREVHLRHVAADAGFASTYQIPIIQGKNFDDALAAVQQGSVIINRAAMNAFGWKDAIGKQLRQKNNPQTYTVIGVMEDFHYRDLQNSIEPLLHWYGGKPSLNNNYLSVRTDHGYIQPVMQQLETSFRSMPSRRSFSYELMSDKVDKQYALLEGLLKITNYVALLTIVIACMGMFGLVASFAKQRVKEIGIRKVLGASVESIITLLSRDFLILVGLAIVIATPIAWQIMNNWLQDFAYRIDIRWWMFALAGLLALIIALTTVWLQAWTAAKANPVNAIKNE